MPVLFRVFRSPGRVAKKLRVHAGTAGRNLKSGFKEGFHGNNYIGCTKTKQNLHNNYVHAKVEIQLLFTIV